MQAAWPPQEGKPDRLVRLCCHKCETRFKANLGSTPRITARWRPKATSKPAAAASQAGIMAVQLAELPITVPQTRSNRPMAEAIQASFSGPVLASFIGQRFPYG